MGCHPCAASFMAPYLLLLQESQSTGATSGFAFLHASVSHSPACKHSYTATWCSLKRHALSPNAHAVGTHTATDTDIHTHMQRHIDTCTAAHRHTHTDTDTQTHRCTHTHARRSFNYFTALESVKHTPSKIACCKTGSRCREQPAYSGLPSLPIRVSLEVQTTWEASRCARSPWVMLSLSLQEETWSIWQPWSQLSRLSLEFHLIKGSKQGTWRMWL